MSRKLEDLDITLNRGWIETGRYVWSPFVTKLEFRLRISGIKYKTAAGNARKEAPTGKIPYVNIQSKSTAFTKCIGDSALIAKWFVEQGFASELNTRLDATDAAHDLTLKALVEDRLYFYNMRERWVDNYYTHRDHILWTMPYALRVLVGNLVYRNIIATLQGQGTGRFTPAELHAFRDEVWTTLNGLMAESKHKAQQTWTSGDNGECFWALGGHEPTECDTALYGFINSALIALSSPESTKLVQSKPAVMDYATRIHNKYFPDYEKWPIA